MTAAYLSLNAVLYAVFALWCAFRLDTTARSLGYLELSNGGRSEYLTVYGGLQWGLALAFAILAHHGELHRAGVLISLAIYVPLVLHRSISLLRFGPVAGLTKGVAVLEWVLLLAAVALWFADAR